MNLPTTDIMLINSRLHSEFLEGNLEDFVVSMVDPRPITFLALCQIFILSVIHSFTFKSKNSPRMSGNFETTLSSHYIIFDREH